jgi:hypothetical protein
VRETLEIEWLGVEDAPCRKQSRRISHCEHSIASTININRTHTRVT